MRVRNNPPPLLPPPEKPAGSRRPLTPARVCLWIAHNCVSEGTEEIRATQKGVGDGGPIGMCEPIEKRTQLQCVREKGSEMGGKRRPKSAQWEMKKVIRGEMMMMGQQFGGFFSFVRSLSNPTQLPTSTHTHTTIHVRDITRSAMFATFFHQPPLEWRVSFAASHLRLCFVHVFRGYIRMMTRWLLRYAHVQRLHHANTHAPSRTHMAATRGFEVPCAERKGDNWRMCMTAK